MHEIELSANDDGELMASFMEFKNICQTLTDQLNSSALQNSQVNGGTMLVMENDSSKHLTRELSVGNFPDSN